MRMRRIVLVVAMMFLSLLAITACEGEAERTGAIHDALDAMLDYQDVDKLELIPAVPEVSLVPVPVVPTEDEAPPIVFTDLNLPVTTQDKIFSPFSELRITADDVLMYPYHTNTGSSWAPEWTTNWRTVATDVRSFLGYGSDTRIYLTNDNNLWGFGSNENGFLGDGTGVDRDEPTLIMSDVAGIYWDLSAVGFLSATAVYALKIDGTLWRWGAGIFYPTLIAENVAQVIGKFRNQSPKRVWFLSNDGGIYLYQENSPITRVIQDTVLHISLERNWNTPEFFFINADGVLKRRVTRNPATHYGTYYEIATNVEEIFVALRDFEFEIRDDIIMHNIHYITSDGTLWGKGRNRTGELGDTTKVHRPEPVQIAENVVYARSFGFLKQDGTWWSWDSTDPTPRQTLDNVEMVYGGIIFYKDGSATTFSGEAIENVRAPRTRTW